MHCTRARGAALERICTLYLKYFLRLLLSFLCIFIMHDLLFRYLCWVFWIFRFTNFWHAWHKRARKELTAVMAFNCLFCFLWWLGNFRNSSFKAHSSLGSQETSVQVIQEIRVMLDKCQNLQKHGFKGPQWDLGGCMTSNQKTSYLLDHLWHTGCFLLHPKHPDKWS